MSAKKEFKSLGGLAAQSALPGRFDSHHPATRT